MLYVTSGEYGYFETIQAFFLELTGKGLVLSSRDIETLTKWAEQGASAATVCVGIERAIDALAEKPRDIWACRAWIQPLVAVARTRAVESAIETENKDVDPQLEALQKIEEAGRAVERAAFKQAYRDAWSRVRAAEQQALWETLILTDSALVQAFLAALSEEERLLVQKTVLADPGLAGMSGDAREHHTNAKTRRILQEKYGMVSPLDV
jgi:hypothetical protein